MGSGQLSMYCIIVCLSFARGLQFDDVKRALSYFASPFLARLFLFASGSFPIYVTL